MSAVALEMIETLKRLMFLPVLDALVPSFTSASQEIIVFEGQTIEISCIIQNVRK